MSRIDGDTLGMQEDGFFDDDDENLSDSEDDEWAAV